MIEKQNSLCGEEASVLVNVGAGCMVQLYTMSQYTMYYNLCINNTINYVSNII